MPPRNMRDMVPNSTDSAEFGFAITPNNDADLTYPVRAITVGTEGVIVYVNWSGDTCTTGTLPVGTYPVKAVRVRATGTTATNLTGWV